MLRPARLAAALLALTTAAQAVGLKDHPGHWLGDLKTPEGRTLKIGAEVFTRADGSIWASVASPDQGAFDIPVQSLKESGESVDLDLPMAVLTLTWTKDHFHGEWKQGPAPLPLELTQVAGFPRPVRPQTPKPPFPYKDEILSIPSAEGVTLGATLSLPNGKPHPTVVILVGGSGPGTRNEEAEGHQSFVVLADHLARQGVAVLRYDKRGVSRSTGDYSKLTSTLLVEDLNAVVQAMRARKEFHRIGLIGHSEGPELAAAVAAGHPGSVDFLVSLAGTGLNGLDSMLAQDRVWATDHGATPAEVDRLMVYVRRYYETIMAQAELEPRITALKALFQGLSPEDKALVDKRHMNEGTLSLEWAGQPFLRASLLADPPASWRAVRCPVLALNGSLDHQVPAEENLNGIVAALKAGGNAHVESAKLPSLNHLFQTAKTGAEDEYAAIDETMAPAVLQRVAAFVKAQR
ncbi:MAG TPA: alpha/beta fold hydrolase [Holophagaceae bacterium]|nr:alpha/beta fold hydrolase [Holophagaceae bacterium]